MRRFYARSLEAKRVPVEEAEEFVQAYHKQRVAALRQSIRSVGLHSGDELLAVAQFTTPRTEKKKRDYSTELLRLAFKTDVRIVGEASKLIKFYIHEFSPADIFTYQDTTGELTDVYEHAGMTLVSQSKKKQYLVAPGKTRETAGRKECYSVASVAMRGPDALLGTALGEVFRENGKRKTNPELFIEELGWHLEETTGDRVYEWIDPNRTFYTYKTTATDSDKYYYGVSHVKKANATVEDCLNDGYYGSGGSGKQNKFKNWKKKHEGQLVKEVIEIYQRHSHAFLAERDLVGDLWRTDPLCLNSTRGGGDGGALFTGEKGRLLHCETHGETLHNGKACMRCAATKRISLDFCSIHGEVKHRDGKCLYCRNGSRVALRTCEIHGLTKHQGDVCSRCNASSSYSMMVCPTHGEVSHHNGKCVTCHNQEAISIRDCPIHGDVKHIGKTCYSCVSESNTSERVCEIHGKTTFQGSSCAKCNAQNKFSIKTCATHGEVVFNGTQCQTCLNNKIVTMRSCPTHGETKHQGKSCCKCSNESLISMKVCPVHGESKHRGNSCYACITDRKRLKLVQ